MGLLGRKPRNFIILEGFLDALLYLLYILTACWAVVGGGDGVLLVYNFRWGRIDLYLVIVRYRESYVDAFSVRCSDFASAGIDWFEYLVRLQHEGGFFRVLEVWRSCMMYVGAGYACFLCIKCRYRAELFLKPTFSFLIWFCVGGFGI